jgi:hypothetical protein
MKTPQWYRECVGMPMFISNKQAGEKWLSKNYKKLQYDHAEDVLSRRKKKDECSRKND